MRIVALLPLLLLVACRTTLHLPDGTPGTESPGVWKALAKDLPRSVIPHVYVAYDALQRGNRREFDRALETARGNAAEDPSHQLAIGTLCVEAGIRQVKGPYRNALLEKAVDHLTRARRLDSKGSAQAFNLGLALLRLKRPAEALPHLQAFASMAPTNRNVLRLITEAYLGDNDPNLALKWIRRDTPGEARTAEDWELVGRCQYFLNQFEEAERAYRQSLKINPEQTWVWNNLGLALRELGRDKEAEECFAESKRRRQKSPR